MAKKKQVFGLKELFIGIGVMLFSGAGFVSAMMMFSTAPAFNGFCMFITGAIMTAYAFNFVDASVVMVHTN